MIPESGKITPRVAWQLTPVFLPGESHGQRRLEGLHTVHGVSKSQTQLTNTHTHTHTHTGSKNNTHYLFIWLGNRKHTYMIQNSKYTKG